MPTRITFICLLIFFCSLQGAHADDSVEIRQRRGLLLLGDIQQWLGLTYEYTGHDSGKNGNYSTNKLEEIYHIDTSAAILDPHLFYIVLSGDIWFQQVGVSSSSSGSSSGNGVRYAYNFAGSAFDRRWYPINIFSSLSLDTVQSPFSPAVNTETGRHGIEFLILKDPYRLKLKYERDTLDLSGGNQNSSQVTDSVDILGSHDYRGISYTSVNATLSTQSSVSSGAKQSGTGFLFGYSNDLYLGRLKKYSITSTLQSNNLTIGGVPQETLNLCETFLGHPGKALDLELDYRYDHNRTGSVSGAPDLVFDVNSGVFLLRHRLFESLYTRLRGNLSQSKFLSGTENKYSGTAGFTYSKKLFEKSRLMVETYGTHEVTDRKLGGNEQDVVNERSHTVTQPNQVITLDHPGPLKPGSVIIRGFAVPPINPQLDPTTLTFIENIDYQIDYPLGRITWIGPVPLVPTIVVDYIVLVDPSLKYSTDTVSLSSTLSLADGKYALSGLIYNQNQHLISGQSQFGLYDTRIAQLRFQGFLGENSFNLEYDDYTSGPSKYRYLEEWWQYNHVVPGASLQLMGRDRYTMYAATNTAAAYSDNTLNLSGTYSKDISDWSRLLLGFIVLDDRGGTSGTSDSISLRAALKMRFNRLTVNLLGSSGWRINGNSTNRDDYVRIEVKRYF
jgi:hypothetical protein